MTDSQVQSGVTPSVAGEQDRNALQAARQRRYEVQRLACKLLTNVKHPRGGTWRVLACLTQPAYMASAVAVMYSESTGRSGFAGACTCGSVWTCPVCAGRISEHRRAEIVAGHTHVHLGAGGTAMLMTRTTSHSLSDPLASLLGSRSAAGERSGLAGATQRFHNDRQTKSAFEMLGRFGFIRAVEITHGQNGFHPHFHDLVFTTCLPDDRVRVAAQERLLRAWQRACEASGLPKPNERGLDLRWAWDASEYLSKFGHEQTWGAARELVSAANKSARRGNRNPWQLLRDAADGDPAARAAFAEYAQATLGKRQLVWQRGLKAAMSIEDRTDEQLAAHVDEDSIVLNVIPRERWRALLKLPFEWRATVLDLAERGGPDAVADFLDLLESDPIVARAFATTFVE